MSVDISGPAYENRTMNSQATAIPRILLDFMLCGTSVITAQASAGSQARPHPLGGSVG